METQKKKTLLSHGETCRDFMLYRDNINYILHMKKNKLYKKYHFGYRYMHVRDKCIL